VFRDENWQFFQPNAGWLCWIEDEKACLAFDPQDGWAPLAANASGGGGLSDQLSRLGINTAANDQNRLSVKADATLLDNQSEDHRVVINKNAEADTSSVVFQSGYTGHAEIGLMGDNEFRLKTSANGLDWQTPFKVALSTGQVQASSVATGKFTLSMNNVARINTPKAGGIFVFMVSGGNYPAVYHSGIIAFDTGPSLAIYTLAKGPDVQSLGTQTLTGYSGAGGQTSVAVAPGQIQIESRITNAVEFNYLFLC